MLRNIISKTNLASETLDFLAIDKAVLVIRDYLWGHLKHKVLMGLLLLILIPIVGKWHCDFCKQNPVLVRCTILMYNCEVKWRRNQAIQSTICKSIVKWQHYPALSTYFWIKMFGNCRKQLWEMLTIYEFRSDCVTEWAWYQGLAAHALAQAWLGEFPISVPSLGRDLSKCWPIRRILKQRGR